MLSVSDFPTHRWLVRQLAGILTAPITEIAVMIEKAAQRNGLEPASENN